MFLNCTKTATEIAASSTAATAADAQLAGIITNNGLGRLPDPSTETNALVLLGETLFSDVALSGNRNISCMSCHSATQGTGDGLPFSIGTGATGTGSARRQRNGQSVATSRNAPPLYNLGRANQNRAFWDGRVALINGVVTSPVTEISGASPTRADIKNAFTSAFDIQPMFPILNAVEMLGSGNDLSAHSTNVDIWQAILADRLLVNSSYVTLFNQAFPTLTTAELNPGHIGRALGAFMKIRFKSTTTPFDSYVTGDLTALSDGQKRGMILFYTKGQCVRCHGGPNFTDLNFHAVAAPQIGFAPFADDTGRAATTGLITDRYKFKTPSLRNVTVTGPYMHDGAFTSLEAVVNHYNNVTASLANYSIPTGYQSLYETALVYDNNATRNANRMSQIDVGQIRNGLGLTAQEQTDIVDFVKNALRDPNFN